MPIEPINVSGFARNPVGIEAILARGSSAFGQILQGLTQVGRDQANNQQAQERDFLTEQRREINLVERRGDAMRAQGNADRLFAEDQRQFGIKFDEGTRQFDSNVENANLDRIQRGRGYDIQEAGQKANQEIARGNLEETRKRNTLYDERTTFERNQATEQKGQRDELYKINLETSLIEKQNALKNGTSAEQTAAANQKHAEAQQGALTHLEELDKTDPNAAKKFFRTTILGGGFSSKVIDELGKRYGEPTAAAGADAGTPVEEMTPAQRVERLQILKDAQTAGGTNEGRVSSEKRRTEIAELEAAILKEQNSKQSAIDSLVNQYRSK